MPDTNCQFAQSALNFLIEELKERDFNIVPLGDEFEITQTVFIVKDGALSNSIPSLEERFVRPAMRSLAETLDQDRKNIGFADFRVDGYKDSAKRTRVSHEGVSITLTQSYDARTAGMKCLFEILTTSSE